MEMKSNRVKGCYDKKVRDYFFEEDQKVWLYNPQKKKEKTPKLQSKYEIIKRLSDVVYCIQRSNRHRKKIVHSNRLVSFYERKE